MNIPDFETWSTKMQGETYLKKHFPEFLQFLIDSYPNVSSIKEKIYLYRNGLNEPGKCMICGRPTKYDGPSKGYRKYCSLKCSNNDIDKKNKTRQTYLEKYGVENPSQSKKIQDKKKETYLEKYGVENPSQSKEIQDKKKETYLEKYGVTHHMLIDDIKEKVKQTCLEKYGVEHISQIEYVKEKVKQTCLEKYGVEHISQLQDIKDKKKDSCLEKYGVEHPMMLDEVKQKVFDSFVKNYVQEHPDIISIRKDECGRKVYKCKCCDLICTLCNKKEYEIYGDLYHSRNYHNLTKCPIKNPIDEKSKNTSIELFIHDILNKHNIKYVTNKRVVGNLELDIYIPDYNIGVECNGIYWHSDQVKPKDYHYHKYKTYKNSDIQVLSIWEDWIKNKSKIVESILLSKLGIYQNKIFARQCTVSLIDYNECKTFLENNHIQGNSNSSVRIGLYYMGELKSVMCFSKKRRSMIGNKTKNENEWELTRFCTELNTIVVGGASRLLNFFIKNYSPKIIVSFASHDISNGSIYKKLNFECVSEYNSSYWYVCNKSYIRYHRYVFRKSELIKMGYDKNMSEFQIMVNLPYYRIYDSGQSKYVMNL